MTPTRSKSRTLVVFLIFFVLGILHSWPLGLYMSKGIPYTIDPVPSHEVFVLQHGDHLQAFYHLGLLQQAASGNIDWFANPLEFVTQYNAGLQPPSYYFLPVSILSLPFSMVSQALGYNMLLLICVALGGLAMFLWAHLLTGNFWAALFAGFVYNFIPVRMAELYGGHPSGLAIFLFPLTLYFFDKSIREKSTAYSVSGGLAVFTLSFQYLYFSYYLLMFLMVYIPWRLLPVIVESIGKGTDEIKKLAGACIPFAIGCLSAIGWMYYYKSSVVSASAFSANRSLSEVALFSPDISSMWSPQLDWKVYFGLPIIALLFGLVAGIAKLVNRRPAGLEYLFFSVLFIVSYILAFGTTVDSHIPLYSLFYDHFPYFNMSRAPSKIMVLSSALLAILLAWFVRWALAKTQFALAWRSGVALLALVTVIDYHPDNGIGICLLDEGNKVYETISKNSDDEHVLNLPIWPGESAWESIYQYYALQSGVAMVNGYSPVVSEGYVENVFWKLFTLNTGNITNDQVEFLKKNNVGHIVFHEEAYPNKVSPFPASVALSRLKASPMLEVVEHDGPLTLFKLSAKDKLDNAPAVSSPMSIVYQAEGLVRIDGKVKEEEDAINGYTLYGDGSMRRAGYLMAGPYQSYPAGKYKAVFRAKVPDNSTDDLAATFDVSSNSGKNILTDLSVRSSDFIEPGKYQKFTLPFEIHPESSTKIEFRAALPKSSRGIYVDWIYVTFADQVDPQLSYETEDFFHIGATVDDPMASAGKAVLVTHDQDPSSAVAYGPYRLLGKGEYTAFFRIKTEPAEPDEKVVVLEVASLSKSVIIAQRGVAGSEIRSDGYAETAIDFLLEEDDFIEYRARFTGAASLYLDRIRIEKK